MKRLLKRLSISLLLLLFFFWVFYFITCCCDSDLEPHANIAISKMQSGKMFSGNFLLYFLMNLFSGFSTEIESVIIANSFLLALAVVAKYGITFHYLAKDNSTVVARVASFSLLFAYILPFVLFIDFVLGYRPLSFLLRYSFYLGYYVPNVWHNSTIIFSMPFTILTYIYSLKLLRQYSLSDCWKLSFVNLICVMIKPSFFFVYSCPYVLLVLYKYGLVWKKLSFLLLPIVIGFAGVGYQYITIYDGSDGSSVIFSLSRLFNYDYWQEHWLYFVSSLFLPLFFFVHNFKKCKYDLEFFFLSSMLLIAILIQLLFQETGPRALHGNFSWQIIPSMWLFYYYILRNELSEFSSISVATLKSVLFRRPVFTLYSLMVFVGLFYFVKYLYFGLYA